MSDAVPSWCDMRRGTAPVLLIAPHGGRRPPIDPSSPPANLRVNDVYTPEVTRALAERLGAGWIINEGMDRNQLDMNRVSQVRRRAPWFLELLAREIAAILERHGRAEVLFIHGWNNGQLKCDIGVGGRECDGVVQVPPGGRLTLSDDYLHGRVRALRLSCARRGIAAPLGEKYPASHANNLVQVFAVRDQSPSDAVMEPFAAFAASERINALQLELTLPLRCPGPWRERFIEGVAEAFRDDDGDEPRPAPKAILHGRVSEISSARPESLQFYDAAAGVGVSAGIGRTSPNSLGGRLLLFLGGQRIALFTGEEMGGHGVPPLHVERYGDVVQLDFRGPILVIADAAEYLDLEAALGASTTIEADLALEFREVGQASAAASFGHVQGELTIDGTRHTLATQGFGHVAALRAAGQAQTMLAASFGVGRAIAGRFSRDGGRTLAVRFDDGVVAPLAEARLRVIEDGDAYTPAAFELHAADLPLLRAEPINRMAILRSSPHGYLRVAFGVARCEWDGLEGFGLYEHALPVGEVKPEPA